MKSLEATPCPEAAQVYRSWHAAHRLYRRKEARRRARIVVSAAFLSTFAAWVMLTLLSAR
jgi:hypothetical protein